MLKRVVYISSFAIFEDSNPAATQVELQLGTKILIERIIISNYSNSRAPGGLWALTVSNRVSQNILDYSRTLDQP